MPPAAAMAMPMPMSEVTMSMPVIVVAMLMAPMPVAPVTVAMSLVTMSPMPMAPMAVAAVTVAAVTVAAVTETAAALASKLASWAAPNHHFRIQNGGGGAGNRTRVRSRVKRNLYECSPGFVLTGASPWDQAPHQPVTVCVAPAAVTPAGAEAAGISVGSGHRSRLTGRRQAVA